MKQLVVGLLLSLLAMPGACAKSVNLMSVENYATIRSAKVCGVYDGYGVTCGTGLFVGPNLIVTKAHIFPSVGERMVFDGYSLSMGTFPLHISAKPQVLRPEDNQFTEAILVSSSTFEDLAILRTSYDTNPAVLFDEDPFRGEKVISVGNPNSEDFEVTKTEISSIDIMNGENGPRLMIGIDSKKRVRPGYSGGGVFTTRGGLIGTVESCNETQCFLTPSKTVERYLKENK